MPIPIAPYCQPPDRNTLTPSFKLPMNACDTHVHVFDTTKYAYQENRSYTPHECNLEDLAKMHKRLGVERAVLIQASVHGIDNSAVLESCRNDLTKKRCVIAVDKNINESQIESFHKKGARGIRLNLVDKGGMPFESIDQVYKLSKILLNYDWHIEFLIHVDDPEIKLKVISENIHVPIVLGHFGYMKTEKTISDKKFQEFLDILQNGNCWVKLTGPYRISSEMGIPYKDVIPFAEEIIKKNSDNVIWGSDWPHVMLKHKMPNDAELIEILPNWLPTEELRKKILVDNPSRLYGF